MVTYGLFHFITLLNVKILLASSSFEEAARCKVNNSNSNYPMGLGYLHAYLENQGHEVYSLFLNDVPYPDCRKRFIGELKTRKPEVVGFNVITQNRTSTFRLIRFLHKSFPQIRVIIGGIHTTVMYEQILRRYPYIIAVLGEGEITASELINRIEQKKSINNVDGIAYVSGRKVIKTKDRGLVTDLDILPFPKHDIFFSDKRTIACMITSRGCPFRCSFCVLNKISRGYPRKRSVTNVINEIEYLIARYPQLETVWFHDDQFFLINSRVIEFCKEIIKRKIKLRFICSGRFKPISKEMVEMLGKAGFIQVFLGLESGSSKVLEMCHKNITQDEVLNAIALFKNTRIQVTVFLIVGLYGETDDIVEETIGFVQKMQRVKYVFFGDMNVAILYPGTELYDIAKAKHVISDSYWLTEQPTPFFTVEHSEKKLFEYKKRIMDGVGLTHIITKDGFKLQFPMLPWIFRFMVDNIPMYPVYTKHVFQRYFPDAYLKIRSIVKSNN